MTSQTTASARLRPITCQMKKLGAVAGINYRIRPLIDKVYPFEAARQAYEHLAKGASYALSLMLALTLNHSNKHTVLHRWRLTGII